MKKLKSIDKARGGGIMDVARKWTGAQSTDWTVYERLLGTSPEEVRDQEERVHQRAGDLAQQSHESADSTEPGMDGDTVSLHMHDSEDLNQDAIHRLSARLAIGRSKK